MLCSNCRHKRAHSRGVLYHFTRLTTLEAILKSDKLLGSAIGGDKHKGVSLTRKAEIRFGVVRIALNTQKILQHNYRIEPFDYFKNDLDGIPNPANEFSKRYEGEEVLIGDLNNLHKYILGIDINEKSLMYKNNPDVIDENRSNVIDLILEYEAKHGLNLNTNFMLGDMYTVPRKQDGTIPSRYDKYKDKSLDWKPLDRARSSRNREDTDLLIDKIINVMYKLKRDLPAKYRINFDELLDLVNSSNASDMINTVIQFLKPIHKLLFLSGTSVVKNRLWNMVEGLVFNIRDMRITLDEEEASKLRKGLNRVITD